MPETTILDETANHRFVHRTGDAEAELVYRTPKDRLVLVHTEVPEAFRGQGIAGQLVQAAVARATRTGETVVPLCPYTRRWLEGHPDVAATITIDWHQPD